MRIAVVGSGISGLGCAWLLTKGGHTCTVFEREGRPGGHTCTVPVQAPDGTWPVDTGFIVFNERTYPLLCRLFSELGVARRPTTMGFSVQIPAAGVEYSGAGLQGLFGQRRNLLRPRFWGMVRDILRFYRIAKHDLAVGLAEEPLEDWLQRHHLGQAFIDWHLLPMAAAVWSTDPQQMRQFPARFLLQFFANHGFLDVRERPQWFVVQGGSATYLPLLAAGSELRLGQSVERVERLAQGVRIQHTQGTEEFDAVVFACHSDQALAMLADPSDDERAVLGALPYTTHDCVLHTDTRLLPQRESLWSAWNYRVGDGLSLTYSMGILQRLPSRDHYCVTLGSDCARVDPQRVIRKVRWSHPLFTPTGVVAQEQHAAISGKRHTYYAGAYWRWGFHEDGLWSAQRVAQQLGVSWP